MASQSITFLISSDQDDYLERVAAERDVSVGQLLRDMIQRDMKDRIRAKTSNRADEHLVARLQRLLVPTMADATSWQDLSTRLASLNHALRPAGGGLTVHALPSGERLCKSSELGFPYARFVRKFQRPMPGHPHKMGQALGTARALSDTGKNADDFSLIERASPFSGTAFQGFRQSAQR